jgi:hypothetical protein
MWSCSGPGLGREPAAASGVADTCLAGQWHGAPCQAPRGKSKLAKCLVHSKHSEIIIVLTIGRFRTTPMHSLLEMPVQDFLFGFCK